MPLERPEKPAGAFKSDSGTTLPDPCIPLPARLLEAPERFG